VGSNPTLSANFPYSIRLPEQGSGKVDAASPGMDEVGDKLVTTQDPASPADPAGPAEKPTRKAGGKGRPVAVVKFGSTSVPVYRCASGGRVRFILSYYRHGRRMRQSFAALDAARREALFVAQRIQSGKQHVTDMAPHDRDAFMSAKNLLEQAGIAVPLVSAIEDYIQARRIARNESLAAIAAKYMKHFERVVREATVAEVVEHLLRARREDGTSERHLRQMRSVLNRFAKAFPGSILEVHSNDVDEWLRGLGLPASSRNTMLRYVKLMFSFARAQNYLPEGRESQRLPR
jgi:hypothetical protein